MQKRKIIRRILDDITEKLLTISGAVTGIAILFITFFLFTEGAALFQ